MGHFLIVENEFILEQFLKYNNQGRQSWGERGVQVPPIYGVGGDEYIIVPALFIPSCLFVTFTFSDISTQGTFNEKF